jgi:hypothetical protein
MDSETITKVELLETKELLLVLESGGSPSYQYVYRAAAGVCWDQARTGFKSTPLVEWSCAKWFSHIVEVAKSELGIGLQLGSNVDWRNITVQDQSEIRRNHAY